MSDNELVALSGWAGGVSFSIRFRPMHQLLERLLCATPDHHRGPRRVVVRAAVPRFVRLTVVLASIATLTVAVFQYRGASQYGVTIPTTPVSTRVDEWTQTPWGPLGPADRDLLVKISQAGLYEGASGQRAQRQAGSAQIRTMGLRISTECGDLDTQARSVAGQLGVVLSNQPTEQQQDWMTELSRLSGAVFDRTFTQRLRHEHGDVLQAIVDVRAGTRNDLIRSFAVAASVLVNRASSAFFPCWAAPACGSAGLAGAPFDHDTPPGVGNRRPRQR